MGSDVQVGSEGQYDKERWQLPGLTGSDAIKPEEWQNFCSKVEPPLSFGELKHKCCMLLRITICLLHVHLLLLENGPA